MVMNSPVILLSLTPTHIKSDALLIALNSLSELIITRCAPSEVHMSRASNQVFSDLWNL